LTAALVHENIDREEIPMTESEWNACADPTPMLEFLRGKASARKLRLAACACVRRVWRLIPDARRRHDVGLDKSFADLRRGVEVAERFADSEATPEELYAAHRAAAVAEYDVGSCASSDAETEAARVARIAASVDAELATEAWPGYAAMAANWEAIEAGVAGVAADACDAVEGGEQRAQAALLRDVFGDPLHQPARIDPGWLAWNDGAIRKMAQTTYDERAFDRLPLLADALEDAGCDNARILAHCREPGEHVPGCWVVDLLLGKD
jgi:hypothetical protein